MVAIVEVAPGSPDARIIERAVRDDRVLLTEDKDFGWLVYAAGHRSAGVVLFRYPSSARGEIGGVACEVVARFGAALVGAFLVVEPGRVRIGSGWPGGS